MSAHGPDERLSAFYDGELSAAERLEVERLLTERPDLRAELSGLSDLSQRLGDLADDLREFDLRPRVLQQISHARRPSAAPVMSAPAGLRRRWKPLILAACSLTLLVAVLLPLLPSSNQSGTNPSSMVAMNGRHENAIRDAEEFDPSTNHPAPMSAPVASVTSATQPPLPTDSPAAAMVAAKSGAAGFGGVGVSAGDGIATDEAGPSEFLADIERHRELKPGELISRMVESGDVPMLAKFTVVDVIRSSHMIEVLLQEHGIFPLVPTEKGESVASRNSASQEAPPRLTKVYLVEADSQSFNTAILKCNELQEVVAVNVEPIGLPMSADAMVASQIDGRETQFDGSVPPAPAAEDATPELSASSVARRSKDEQETVDQKNSSDPRLQMKMAEEYAERLKNPEVQAKSMRSSSAAMKSKLAYPMNGNVLAIDNGDEVVAELEQRQNQPQRNASPSLANTNDVPKKESLSPVEAKEQALVDSISRNSGLSQSRAILLNNDLQYGNSFNRGRSRQRAFLVLRPQSPPPPPEPTRIAP